MRSGDRRAGRGFAALAVLSFLPGLAAGGQIRLEEVTGASGVDYRNVTGEPEKRFIVSSLGAGAGLLDYDQDGDLDLYLVNGAPLEDRTSGPGLPNRLFRNEGEFRFSDQTGPAGVGDTGWGYGVAVADVDNDGFPDLYVTNLGENVLYRNRGDGTFERVPAAGGASHPGYSTSAAFLDAENDGDLDLVVLGYTADSIDSLPLPGAAASCVWFGLPVFCGPSGLIPAEDGFFRNRGDGTFEDFTTASGIAAAEAGYGLGVVAGDLDGDGDTDLYVANDSVPNHLFVNDGQGRFTEQALLAGTAYNVDGLAQAGMGVDAGDFDEDGQLDLFVTNFSHDTNTAYRNAGKRFLRGQHHPERVADAGLVLPGLGDPVRRSGRRRVARSLRRQRTRLPGRRSRRQRHALPDEEPGLPEPGRRDVSRRRVGRSGTLQPGGRLRGPRTATRCPIWWS